MAKQKFKYNINKTLNDLPRTISISDVEEALKKYNISRDSFYRDRNILLGSEHSIPSDRLDAYAIVFGCTADDLKNYKKLKGKSIIERYSKSKTQLK